ncbi:response regulator [Sinobacterium norvegicum]|nr:response regulator [Sinobacterium norvegicum]
MKILYVDDEPKELKYFKRALNHSFDIVLADSVDEGILLLDQPDSNISVVITDQRMPNKLGTELLSYAQQNHPSITRMLTTAYCDIESAISAINDVEVFRYIPKPWDIESLGKELELAVEKNYATSQVKTDFESQIMAEANEDCQQWLEYAERAYADEKVYRHGIEAFASKYYLRVREQYDDNETRRICQKIDLLIDEIFLDESITGRFGH